MSDKTASLARRLFAEALGTALLVTTVIGSGIMAERLAGGNEGVALHDCTIPVGAILVVLITILAPVSGAHFNPAVTLVFAGRGEFPWRELIPYVIAQSLGAICGTVLAHLMFGLAPLMIGTAGSTGPAQWLAEATATFTLLLAILGGIRYAPKALPALVGLTIIAACWFSSSTSAANPVVTLARGFTATFAGLAINHVPVFVAAEFFGAIVAALMCAVLFPARPCRSSKVGEPSDGEGDRAMP